jgi:peptide/nickel transport system substrate-binding protein
LPNDIRLPHYNTASLFGAIGRLACFTLALIGAGCTPAGGTRGGDEAVRFAVAADPQTLDPLFLHPDAASVELQLARLSFEPFVDLDAVGRPVPALLSQIPARANGGISADGRTIVYRLRRQARWSDGRPVTSGDVLFTLRAILDPRNPVRSHAGYELIDRAIARDAHTVVLHLRRAWGPAATTYFSYGTAPQFVLPAHVLRGENPLAQAPYGADPTVVDGPFRLRWWHRGEGLRYEANPQYWRRAPKSKTVDVRIVPDPSTNLLLLQSGQLDWNLIAPAQHRVLEGKRGLAFLRVNTAVVAGLAFNVRRPPLDDARVRRAIAMSIDRQTISRKITLGWYPVANSLQPAFSWANDPNVREPDYDPAAADAALASAGWRRGPDGTLRRNGRRLELVYVQFPESTTGVRVATTVQAQLHARGIDVAIKSISNAQLFLPKTGALASGDFDLAYVPWTMGADPDDSSVLACGAPSNYMGWCDPQVDVLERAALGEASQRGRKAAYAHIAAIVAHDVPILFLFDADYVYAYSTRLHGFAPNAFVPTWNAAGWQLR